MSLADVLRKGVATARKITLPLHVSVQFSAWIGQDGNGNPTYAAPRVLKALVNREVMNVKTDNGQFIKSTAQIYFLEEVTPNGAAERIEPIDLKDIIIMPDGVTGPILKVDGFFDGGTSVPYYSQVYLG